MHKVCSMCVMKRIPRTESLWYIVEPTNVKIPTNIKHVHKLEKQMSSKYQPQTYEKIILKM
jgi:hypothetical protein